MLSRLFGISILIVTFSSNCLASQNLMIFCGAAFKRPMEEVAVQWKKKTGTEIFLNYASVPALFSQILFSKKGDLLIVPSPDLMEKALTRKVVTRDSIKDFAYFVPAINVLKGNPKRIMGLGDLGRGEMRVAIGNPEIVFIGALAVEIFEKCLVTQEERNQLRKNIVTYAEDFSKLAMFLILNQVDAIIGFHYLSEWYPDKVETVKLRVTQVQRIGSAQVGILNYSSNKQQALTFINFLLAEPSRSVFKNYHYFGTAEEAFKFIGARKPIGGEYTIHPDWLKK